MKEQDVRAVEALCRCGMDLEGVQKCFPKFSEGEIEAIYTRIRKITSKDVKVSI